MSATQQKTANPLETASSDLEMEERPRRKKDTFSRAKGLLKTDQPAPTDEEVEQWLEERRIQKYG